MSNEQYVAGSCNIGPAERSKRMQVSWIGLAVSVLLGVLLWRQGDLLQAAIFAPLMMWSAGLLQARRRFCMAYGWAGVFALDALGRTTKSTDPDALAADRQYALRIARDSVLLALLVTVGYVLVAG